MNILQRVVIGVVLSMVGLGALNSGVLDSFMSSISTAADRLSTSLHTLLLALSLPALLLGGVIAISPKHRQLGTELAVGGLIGLAVASIGPTLVHWLQGAMATYSSSLLGGLR